MELLDPEHHHRKATGGKPMPHIPGYSVAEELTLRRLRTDRHVACRATLARWGRTDAETGEPIAPDCPQCPGLTHNAEHLLCVCPIWAEERRQHLGQHPTVAVLHTNPKVVIGYLRAIGLLAPDMAP